MSGLASYIDHTILKPTTTHIDINKICDEALEYGFAAVCVPPSFVALARQSGARVATVIGFPFGYSVMRAKLAEVEQALADGADELDVVINLTALKEGDWGMLAGEMQLLMEPIHRAGRLLKVIIESGVLTDEEIIRCCTLYGGMGVDFLKTSTGYAEKGASIEAVRLMRQHLPPTVRIKASGGIRTAVLARQLIDAGASRLGTSSGVSLVCEQSAGAGGY
ncbi:MAG TPA: deoxyribose-phosphate aldolase [Puia sp.]|nr:deoxyribose-phosphate aldolase [Puia sp.]